MASHTRSYTCSEKDMAKATHAHAHTLKSDKGTYSNPRKSLVGPFDNVE